MLHSLRKRRCEDGASPSGNGIEHMCPHHWELAGQIGVLPTRAVILLYADAASS